MLKEMEEALSGIDIRVDEPLKNYTYTKVGGPADYLAFPRNRFELVRLVHFANKHSIPWLVLGNASNLIVRDGGIRGMVIMFDRLKTTTIDGYVMEVEAGANLKETTKVARDHSLTGFEFAAGIPGSVGGAVFMNAGAYWGGNCPCACISSGFNTRWSSKNTRSKRLEVWLSSISPSNLWRYRHLG